ncbi:MAG: hypothetical protein R2880_13395 [Deinococcales bacterium]
MGKEPFSYKVHKDGLVRIFWQGRCVMTLGGDRGQMLAQELQDAGEAEQQYILQRVTGNFKRGNERLSAKKRR